MSTETLTEQLARERAHWGAKIPAAQSAVMLTDLEQLSRSELPQRALRAGERAPNFRLRAADGSAVELDVVLARGPAVLVFYRGQWCPYCNLELRAYQQLLPQFGALGASLIAISPQTPDNSLSTAEKNALAFPVLADVGSHAARAYGVAFDLTPELKDLYANHFGNDLTRYNGDDGWTLPVPATYLVMPGGRIALAHVDVDYRRRLEPSTVLNALQYEVLQKVA